MILHSMNTTIPLRNDGFALNMPSKINMSKGDALFYDVSQCNAQHGCHQDTFN